MLSAILEENYRKAGRLLKNIDAMKKILQYIEDHIDEPLTAVQLAEEIGYSFYYFCHLFVSYTDCSVGMYLRRRRLELAAMDLLSGCSATETALKRGFETPSGFAKAFRKAHGVSPSEYIKKGGIIMTPEIKKVEAFTVIGYTLAASEGDFNLLDSVAYWEGKDFSAVSKEDYEKLTYPGYAEVGSWIHPDPATGGFTYYFGPIVKNTDYIPEGMSAFDFPASDYAVFRVPPADTSKGLSENIRRTWKEIYTVWLDETDYDYNYEALNFEYYLGQDTFIYIPVKSK